MNYSSPFVRKPSKIEDIKKRQLFSFQYSIVFLKEMKQIFLCLLFCFALCNGKPRPRTDTLDLDTELRIEVDRSLLNAVLRATNPRLRHSSVKPMTNILGHDEVMKMRIMTKEIKESLRVFKESLRVFRLYMY